MKASEAKKISKNNDPAKAVEAILELVGKQASNGKYEIRVGDYGFGDSVMYSLSESQWNPQQKTIVAMLRELGYDVHLEVIESQFVNIYLQISWLNA